MKNFYPFSLEGNYTLNRGAQGSVYQSGIVEVRLQVDQNSTSAVRVSKYKNNYFDLNSFVVTPGEFQAKNASAPHASHSDPYGLTVTLVLTNKSGVASGILEFRIVNKGESIVGIPSLWLVTILASVAVVWIRRISDRT